MRDGGPLLTIPRNQFVEMQVPLPGDWFHTFRSIVQVVLGPIGIRLLFVENSFLDTDKAVLIICSEEVGLLPERAANLLAIGDKTLSSF